MANQNKLFTVLESDERTVPKTLELIIKNIEEQVENVTENHLLIGLMYTLMLECGYYLSTRDAVAISDDDSSNCSHEKASSSKMIHQTISFSYENVLSQSDLLSKNFLISSETLYKVPFELLGVEEYSFLLMIIPSERETVVNLVVFESDSVIDCYSVAFTSTSVISTMKSADVAMKFNNLKDFCILFKNNIALKEMMFLEHMMHQAIDTSAPGRSLVLNIYNLLNNSLEGMPVEILLKIMKYLTTDDQEKVASLSSTLYSKTSTFLTYTLHLY